jgi:hypothetical protein
MIGEKILRNIFRELLLSKNINLLAWMTSIQERGEQN